MFVQSIEVDEGCMVIVGEPIHVDSDGLIGDFPVHSIGIYPNGMEGDVEVRVEVEVSPPDGRTGFFAEIALSECEW
jgi:hypothetical protein|tara:strand:+ start:2464 stop:2691 length:228 start_codon:yes stop_codon:yes gene_type:complete